MTNYTDEKIEAMAADMLESRTWEYDEPDKALEDGAAMLRGLLAERQAAKAAIVTDAVVPVGYSVPQAKPFQDGSMEEGPDYFVYANEASEHEKRIGMAVWASPPSQPSTGVPEYSVNFPMVEFLSLLMCSDPYPCEGREAVVDFVNILSVDAGFTDWIDAYHQLPAAAPRSP